MDSPWFKMRGYLHFDTPISLKKANELVSCPERVAKHSFYPFISCTLSVPKLKKNTQGKLIRSPKKRVISYASHKDSHIFSYYAYILNKKYEQFLNNNYININNSVLAFRKLGKNNINFAEQAFNYIKQAKNCSVIALDISDFFGNLDHKILKKQWCKLLGEETLPNDHFAVYKAITQYTTISKNILFKEFKISLHTPRSDNRKRICTPEEFRLFRKKHKLSLDFPDQNLFIPNKNKGIPQGSPISALLSNIYMLDFDDFCQNQISKLGGLYLRYCDDILCIVPTPQVSEIHDLVLKEIMKLKLEIHPTKTEIITFGYDNNKRKVINNKKLQYLGFILKDESITIRPAAFTKYSKKMKRGVSLAKQTQRKYNIIRSKKNLLNRQLFKKKLYSTYSHFGRRNFISYARKAAEIMESPQIRKQLKPLWKRLQYRIKN